MEHRCRKEVVDVDVEDGNGAQEALTSQKRQSIFWQRSEVVTVTATAVFILLYIYFRVDTFPKLSLRSYESPSTVDTASAQSPQAQAQPQPQPQPAEATEGNVPSTAAVPLSAEEEEEPQKVILDYIQRGSAAAKESILELQKSVNSVLARLTTEPKVSEEVERVKAEAAKAVADAAAVKAEAEKMLADAVAKSNNTSMEEDGRKWAEALKKKNEAAHGRMVDRRNQGFGDKLPKDETKAYFYYAPSYSCPSEERVGDIKDGGKWVCDPTSLNSNSVVYSIGSNADVSFETELHSLCNGCQIHSFDMTVAEDRMQPIRDAEAAGILKFHPYGLGTPGSQEPNVKPLKDIMAELGHTYIDIFKIDCESCEWDFFRDILQGFPPVLFGQILVELHPFYGKPTNQFMKDLEQKGYLVFHYETNAIWRAGIEFAMIHESLVKSQ